MGTGLAGLVHLVRSCGMGTVGGTVGGTTYQHSQHSVPLNGTGTTLPYHLPVHCTHSPFKRVDGLGRGGGKYGCGSGVRFVGIFVHRIIKRTHRLYH